MSKNNIQQRLRVANTSISSDETAIALAATILDAGYTPQHPPGLGLVTSIEIMLLYMEANLTQRGPTPGKWTQDNGFSYYAHPYLTHVFHIQSGADSYTTNAPYVVLYRTHHTPYLPYGLGHRGKTLPIPQHFPMSSVALNDSASALSALVPTAPIDLNKPTC